MSEQLALIQQEHAEVQRAMVSSPSPFFDKLRDYQKECLSEVRRHIREAKARGEKGVNILLCAPTGSGKTLIASYIIYETAKNLRRACFVVDRINLVDQTAEAFDAAGIEYGVHQAMHWKYRPYERVQLCSAQTLARREWPAADVIVVDEAHTVNEVTKKRIMKRDCITLGLSATPFTKELGLIYDHLVNVTTTNKLIDAGFLAPFRIFAASEPNMDGVKVKAGEWDEKEASKRALAVVGDCVSEYQKHCSGMKFICSAVDVDHVMELHKQFMDAGIMCATYTYRDKDEDRKEIVKEFKKPDSFYRGLITVTAATKGFDVPDIECVIMARPLRKSLAEVIQFFGRGLRISKETGKEECIVLDHSGNLTRFYEDWTEFFETGALELDDGKKRPKEKAKKKEGEESFRKCPKCHHVHAPMPFCPACGHEYPKKLNAVQHEPGTLSELLRVGTRKQLDDTLWPQICAFAHTSKLGDPKGAEKLALATYHDLTGDFPKGKSYGTTVRVAPTSQVLNKIQSKRIAWMKAQRKNRRGY